MVRDALGQIPYVGALITSGADEEHYFIVPYRLAEHGYALHSIRVLPTDVPPINGLEKRRYFHVQNDQTDELIRTLLLNTASPVKQEGKTKKLVNPVLRQFEISLNSQENENDPLLGCDLNDLSFSVGDQRHMSRGTESV
ncbi:MAG: hypothetical protein CMO80_14485 [Verrucomicrobiales bacterium]|nr:hypothetical protein [Verrucomicrobiales bacterium]